jgi:hypothetical protein
MATLCAEPEIGGSPLQTPVSAPKSRASSLAGVCDPSSMQVAVLIACDNQGRALSPEQVPSGVQPRYELEGGAIVVGRSVSGPFTLVIADPSVSGRHAILHINASSMLASVEDLGSTSGTATVQFRTRAPSGVFRRASRHVSHGDIVSFARVPFRFLWLDLPPPGSFDEPEPPRFHTMSFDVDDVSEEENGPGPVTQPTLLEQDPALGQTQVTQVDAALPRSSPGLTQQTQVTGQGSVMSSIPPRPPSSSPSNPMPSSRSSPHDGFSPDGLVVPAPAPAPEPAPDREDSHETMSYGPPTFEEEEEAEQVTATVGTTADLDPTQTLKPGSIPAPPQAPAPDNDEATLVIGGGSSVPLKAAPAEGSVSEDLVVAASHSESITGSQARTAAQDALRKAQEHVASSHNPDSEAATPPVRHEPVTMAFDTPSLSSDEDEGAGKPVSFTRSSGHHSSEEPNPRGGSPDVGSFDLPARAKKRPRESEPTVKAKRGKAAPRVANTIEEASSNDEDEFEESVEEEEEEEEEVGESEEEEEVMARRAASSSGSKKQKKQQPPGEVEEDEEEEVAPSTSSRGGRRNAARGAASSSGSKKQKKQPPPEDEEAVAVIPSSSSRGGRRKATGAKPSEEDEEPPSQAAAPVERHVTRNTFNAAGGVSVAFTGAEPSAAEKALLNKLGMRSVDDVEQGCVVVVAQPVKRTVKLFLALSHGYPVSEHWLPACGAEGIVLDPARYLPDDDAAEKRYQFRFSSAIDLRNSAPQKLLSGMRVVRLSGCAMSAKDLSSIVAANGGTAVSKLPTSCSEKDLVIGSESDLKGAARSRLQAAGAVVWPLDALLRSICRQQLCFGADPDLRPLFTPEADDAPSKRGKRRK